MRTRAVVCVGILLLGAWIFASLGRDKNSVDPADAPRTFPPAELFEVGFAMPNAPASEQAADEDGLELMLTLFDVMQRMKGVPRKDRPPGPAELPGRMPADDRSGVAMGAWMLLAMEPLWRSEDWNPDVTRRANRIADALVKTLDAPQATFVADAPGANQAALEVLVAHFDAYVARPTGLAAVLTGKPLVGVPLRDGDLGEAAGAVELTNGVVLESHWVENDAGEACAALVATMDGSRLWAIRLTEADAKPYRYALLEHLRARDFGRYGRRITVPVSGRPLHVYLDPGGNFLFYMIPSVLNSDYRFKPLMGHLRLTVATGNDAELERLLRQGADPHTKFRHDENLLHVAAGGGHLSTLRKLIGLGLDPDDPQTGHGGSAIHYALWGSRTLDDLEWLELAGTEHRAIVAFLLDRGTPLDVGVGRCGSPLHVAAGHGRLAIVKMLLERGAPLETQDFLDETPLHNVASSELAVTDPQNMVEIARLLLDRGADIEPRTKVGGTPLEMAVRTGSLELTQFLLDRGAQFDRPNRRFLWSAVFHACAEGRPRILRLLLERGADVKQRGQNGRTTLHAAGFSGNVEVAEILLEAGLDVNTRDGDGATPLHRAAAMDRLSMLRFLLARGADVRAVDDEGWTALHHAADASATSEATLRLLLKRGLDIHGKTNDGKTPLEISLEVEALMFANETPGRLRKLGASH